MPVERIDSLYDVQKILAEAEQVQQSTALTQESLMKLYQATNQFKGSSVTTVGENWNKVAVAMSGVSDASDRLNTSRAQAIDGINKQTEAVGKLKVKTDEELKSQIEARQALQARTKEIIAQTDAYKALDLQYQKAAANAKTLQATALKTGSPQDRAAANTASAQANALALQLKNIDQSVGQSQRKVGDYTGALKILETQLAEVNAQMKSLATAGQADTEAYSKLSTEAGLLNTLVGQQERGFSSVTMEIRNNERALQSLRAAGLESSAAFDELRLSTAGAAREQREFQRGQRILESVSPLLTGLTIAAKGLAGAYAVGAGAAALLADGDEKVQKELTKLVAIMTILQGLQQTYELIQERGAINLAIRAAQTKAVAAATELYEFVTEGATVATVAFNAALVATGIGAVLALLGGLVYVLTQNKHELEDNLEAQTKLNKAVQDYNDALVEENKHLGDLLDKNLDSYKSQIAVAGIMEKSIKDHEDLSKLREEEQIQIRKNLTTELNALELTDDGVQILKQSQDELNKSILEKEKLLALHPKEFDERGVKEAQAEIEAQKTLLQTYKTKTNRFDELKNKLKESDDETTRLNFEDIKYANELYEKKIAAILKMKQGYESLLITINKGFEEDPNTSRKQKEDALTAGYKLQSALIKQNVAQQLRDQKLTEEEKSAIIYDGYLKQYELALDFKVRKGKIEEDIQKKEIDLEKMTTQELYDEEQKRIKIAADAAKKRHDDAQSYDNENKDILGTGLNAKYINGLISAKKYSEEKTRIERQGERDIANNNIAALEEQKKRTGDTAQIDEQIAANKKKLSDLDLADFTDKETKKKKLSEEELTLANASFDLLKTAVDARYTNELNHIQTLIDANTKLKQQELDRIESSTLSEQDKAAQVIQLNARIQASNDALAIRQRQIKHEQAVTDKEFAVAKAIEEGIIATLAALADGGPIEAAIVAAIAAVSIAKLIATPIPTYMKGTEDHPGGTAIVHQGELIIQPGKDPILTTKSEQIMQLSRHTRVIPRNQVDQLMEQSVYVNNFGGLQSGQDRSQINITKLTDAVKDQTHILSKVFSKQKRPIVNVNVEMNEYIQSNVFK